MSSSSSRRRRSCGNGGTAPSWKAAEARDWASLPRDIVLDIFLRPGPREVMLGAEFACKPWRRVALEEPSLWRRIGTESPAEEHWSFRPFGVVNAMKLVAVDRAAGQCEVFHGSCDDEFLLDLVGRAPALKCLHINEHYGSDHDESGEGLVQALMKLPLLEELLVWFKYIIDDEDRDESLLQSVCKACPRLKKLVLIYAASSDIGCDEDEHSKERIDGEIPLMPKLKTLELYECDLTAEGLRAILDSCPVLKTLHIDGYFNKREMDKELRMKCARVKNLALPTRKRSDYSYDDEEYSSSDADSQDDYSEDDDSME